VYPDWESAAAAAGGYSEKSLVRRLEEAALAVQRGEATWDQDGVVHDTVPPNLAVLYCIARVALKRGGKVSVLDYGGALGSQYRQCRALLPELTDLKWNIVEQELIVESGKRNFETSDLVFDDNVDSVLKRGTPDVVLLSGVLQYLEQPYALMEWFARSPIQYLIIDRHPCSLTDELITVQVVPPCLYPASYPSWLFDCNRVSATLGKHYELLMEWDGKDPPIYGKGIGARFKGSFWRKRSGS
jgi:putative methyltransferase (TIGR04325 family)